MTAQTTLLQAVAEERRQIHEWQAKILQYPNQKNAARQRILEAKLAVKDAQARLAEIDSALQVEVAENKDNSNADKRKAALVKLHATNPNYLAAAAEVRQAEGALEQANLELTNLEEQCKVLRLCLEGSIANQLAYATPKILLLSEVSHGH